MVRNIIIAIIAIIVLWFILSWAGIIGGGDEVVDEPIGEVEEVEPATD